MKVAVISGHFMPELGYQEVYLARAFARKRYDVMVFTSTKVSPNGRKIIKEDYKPGLETDEKYGYKIFRLKPLFSLGAKIFSAGLVEQLTNYKPDAIIIIGSAKLFPLPILLSKKLNGINKIALFGDSEEYIQGKALKGKLKYFYYQLQFSVVKKFIYNLCIKKCNRIVFNIPEVDKFFDKFINNIETKKIFEKKKINLNLGYDPDDFYFDPEERLDTRKHIGIDEKEPVIITSTRVTRSKELESIVGIVSSMHNDGINVHYILIGFQADSYSQELQNFINTQPGNNFFHCYPFLSHNDIRKYYNASDFGVWSKAAITIQEAMGTGLFVFIKNNINVSHLLKGNENGYYYSDINDLKTKVTEMLESTNSLIDSDNKFSRRLRVEELNKSFLSYDEIINKLLK